MQKFKDDLRLKHKGKGKGKDDDEKKHEAVIEAKKE